MRCSLSRILGVYLSLRFGPHTESLGQVVELRASWLFCQLKDLLVAFPRPDIRLRIGDIQNQLQMVVVQAAVALLDRHLVAVGGAVLVEPAGLLEVVGVYDECIALPVANRISVPARFRVLTRKFAAVRPYIAPGAVGLEELKYFFRSLGKSHSARRRVPQDSREARGVAPPYRIVPVLLVR